MVRPRSSLPSNEPVSMTNQPQIMGKKMGPDTYKLVPGSMADLVLDDLSEYSRERRSVTWQRLQDSYAEAASNLEWRCLGPISESEVRAYYRNSRNLIAAQALSNMESGFPLRNHAPSRVSGKVIDFGGGIGSLAILLAKAGRQVTYLDLPSDHRDFAEWRFRRHRADISVIGDLDELPSESYDALVGVNVFELIHPEALPRLVSEIRRVLKPGGKVVDVNNFSASAHYPQHINHEDDWDKQMKINAFTRYKTRWLRDGRSFADPPTILPLLAKPGEEPAVS